MAVHSYGSWVREIERVFFKIILLQNVCSTNYLTSLETVTLGISQSWCPRKGHSSALGIAIEAGYGCPARMSMCPEDRVLAKPRRAPRSRLCLDSIHKYSEYQCLAWKPDSEGWGVSKRGCDPPKALTIHLNPLDAV